MKFYSPKNQSPLPSQMRKHRSIPSKQQIVDSSQSMVEYYSDIETNLFKRTQFVRQIRQQIFLTPPKIQELTHKRIITNQEANKRKQQFFDREQRKQQLINDPQMQNYLQHLKKFKLRLPSIIQ